jgi:hypothetical protein
MSATAITSLIWLRERGSSMYPRAHTITVLPDCSMVLTFTVNENVYEFTLLPNEAEALHDDLEEALSTFNG